MKLWPRNAKEKMTIQEDIDFLDSMATDRKASIAGLDKVEADIKKRKLEREYEANKRQEKERLRVEATKLVSTDTVDDDISVAEENNSELAKVNHTNIYLQNVCLFVCVSP